MRVTFFKMVEDRLSCIDRAEHVVGEHLRRWRQGKPTPCAEVLNSYADRWAALDDGEGLTIDWPNLTFLGTVESAGSSLTTARR